MLRTTLLAALGGLLLLGLGSAGRLDDDSIRVTALFDDSAGLFAGNDVGVLGVPVGEVERVTPRGEVVEVALRIDDGVAVSARAGAVVVARSVATDRYVELTPAFSGGAKMADGATIPIDRTRTPVEFDEVLGSLRSFSAGMLGRRGDAGSLRRLLRAGAETLDGRGAATRATIGDLATAADSLAGHSDEIVGTISDLDDLTSLLAADRAVVDDFVRSVADATDLFADERHALGRSLTALGRALRSLSTFVEENRDYLRRDLGGLTVVVERLLDRERELAETVEVLPLTMRNIGDAIGANRRLDVKIPTTDLSPVPQVTGPVCAALPVVCHQLGTDPDLGELLNAVLEFLGGGL